MVLQYVDDMVRREDALLARPEVPLLYNLAKDTNVEGCVVEIGSYKGGSTICLALGSRDGNKEGVYAIDPHKGVKPDYHNNTEVAYLDNLKATGADNYVTSIFKTSIRAIEEWDKPIRLLFIDGSHVYEDVRADFLMWEPYLTVGGVIALHDSTAQSPTVEGPRRVVNEYIKTDRFKDIQEVVYTTYAIKVK